MKIKKVLAAALAVAMAAAMASCGDTGSGSGGKTNEQKKSADGKTVLNIWSFTEEVPNMIDKYIELRREVRDQHNSYLHH